MIEHIDGALVAVLRRQSALEGAFITFRPPHLEGAKPRVNFYLHDVRENVALRESTFSMSRRPGDELAQKKRSRIRLDLSYLVTTHADEPEIEHGMLSATLGAILRFPVLPKDLFDKSISDPEAFLEIAQPDRADQASTADIWASMRSRLRPSLSLKVTAAFDPFEAESVPTVREIYFGLGWIQEGGDPERPQIVGGTIVSAVGCVVDDRGKPIKNATVSIRGLARTATTDEKGYFYFLDLPDQIHPFKKHEFLLDVEARGYKVEPVAITALGPGQSHYLKVKEITLTKLGDAEDSVNEKARQRYGSRLLADEAELSDTERGYFEMITGRLRFPNGNVGEYIPLRLGSFRTVTDKEGRYRLPAIPGSIIATIPGVGDREVKVADGTAHAPDDMPETEFRKAMREATAAILPGPSSKNEKG